MSSSDPKINNARYPDPEWGSYQKNKRRMREDFEADVKRQYNPKAERAHWSKFTSRKERAREEWTKRIDRINRHEEEHSRKVMRERTRRREASERAIIKAQIKDQIRQEEFIEKRRVKQIIERDEKLQTTIRDRERRRKAVEKQFQEMPKRKKNLFVRDMFAERRNNPLPKLPSKKLDIL